MTLEQMTQELIAADERSSHAVEAFTDAILSGASIPRKMELETEAWKALGAAEALAELLQRYY